LTIRINLALQGGGAHGAFTWGVLDRFLDEDDLEIAGISGTSAGALNGAAFKAGLVSGGRQGARAALDQLWESVAAVGDLRVARWLLSMIPLAGLVETWTAMLPLTPAEFAEQVFSPYAYGPFYVNPLRRIVESFNMDHVCHSSGPQLFVSATNVRTGKIRVFAGRDVTTDCVLASACLPTIFQAVDIPDPESGRIEPYWDGGYSGNPALFPLFAPDLPDDIVIVNINPLERAGTPKTPNEIQDRINEISFNSSLLRELRAIAFVKKLLADKTMPHGAMKDVLVHMVADDALMNSLTRSTKLMPSPELLLRLKSAGQAAAEAFLVAHKAKIGVTGSVDLARLYG
jgi:NTE family protein